jgi:hypothetical protein
MSVNPVYPIHPAAEIFPIMGDKEFAEFKKDVETYGVKEFGTLYRGAVLDGRNRYKACQELGIEMTFCEIDEDENFDPIAYVLSHNLHRRHLNAGQRADVADKIATMRQGTRTDIGSKDTKSITDAAEQMKVSPASVKRRRKVRNKGSDEVNAAITDGTLPVTTASEFVDAVPDKHLQTEIVNKGVDAVRQAVKSKPLAQKRLTKEQAAEKRKQANVAVEVNVTASPGLTQLRQAWAQASQEEREAFISDGETLTAVHAILILCGSAEERDSFHRFMKEEVQQ